MTDPRERRPVRRRIDPWTGKSHEPLPFEGALVVGGMILFAALIVGVAVAAGYLWLCWLLFVLIPVAAFTRGRYPRR